MGKWFGLDNLSEHYLEYSPYHYAGNNPILFYDIDGNQYTQAAWKWVKKLLNNMRERLDSKDELLAAQDKKLKEGKISQEKYQKKIQRITRSKEELTAKFDVVKAEIWDLAISDQLYHVEDDSHGTSSNGSSSTTRNHTSYNFNENRVEITVSGGTDLALFAHELKYAHQFEKGEIGLGSKNRLLGLEFILDQNDELAAHQREALFGGTKNYSSVRDLDEYYHHNYPSGPVNIHNLNAETSTAIMISNKRYLQALANQRRQAFRVNNKTYVPRIN